jgi:very-short-patch-repair endonuclease
MENSEEKSYKALSMSYRLNKEFADEVNAYTAFLPEDATPLQRVWHYKSRDAEPKLCMCGKPRKFIAIKYYRQTCGDRKCWSELITSVRRLPEKIAVPDITAMQAGLRRKFEGMTPEQLKALDNDQLGKAIRQSEKVKSVVYKNIPDEITPQLAAALYKEDRKPSVCSCGAYVTKIRLDTCGRKECKNRKRSDTVLTKYGTPYVSQSKHIQDIKKKSRISKYSRLVEPDELIDSDGYFMECRCAQGHTYQISQHLIRQRKTFGSTFCTECNPVGSFRDSAAQKEIFAYLTGLGVDVKQRDRKIIGPMELDIVVRSKKIAIEFNGLYYHSDVYKKDDYHLNKTILAKAKGYSLIHVWEDDWMERKEIVMSMLTHKLGVSRSIKVDARKCEIFAPSVQETKLFMEDNHLQGSCPSSVRLALRWSGKTVSMMTFGKPRAALGGKRADGWELLRFCSRLGHSVRGGASRLFSEFLSAHSGRVYSYSDNSRNSGGVYGALGFVKVSDGEPNYWYVKEGRPKREHRYAYRKDVLVSQGFDPAKTERDIMADRGYYRVYDCGSSKWVRE